MAWRSPEGGIGGFNDFGDAKVWQAGQTGELADLANKPQYAETYKNILESYNAAPNDVVTSGTWMNPEGTVVEEEERDHRMGIEPPPYPSKWNPFTWFNQGGIASLENRPGYRWGGFGRQKEDPVHGYVWGGGSGPYGSHMTDRDITGAEFTGYDMYKQPMKIGRRGPIHALARGYVDPEIDFRDMDPGMAPRRTGETPQWFLNQFQRGTLEEEENLAGGGAVGLEPGIGSLMGYAKGGMVTKVKVPKGQSKWMKKFINNMRDS